AQLVRLQSSPWFSVSGGNKNFACAILRLADRNHHLLVLVPDLETRAARFVHLKKSARPPFIVVQVNAGITFLGFQQDWHFVAAMPNGDHFGVEKQKWRARLLRQLLLLANHAQNLIKI